MHFGRNRSASALLLLLPALNRIKATMLALPLAEKEELDCTLALYSIVISLSGLVSEMRRLSGRLSVRPAVFVANSSDEAGQFKLEAEVEDIRRRRRRGVSNTH